MVTPQPHILVFEVPNEAVPASQKLVPAVQGPDDSKAFRLGMWPVEDLGGVAPSTPNTLEAVLQLYGYEVMAAGVCPDADVLSAVDASKTPLLVTAKFTVDCRPPVPLTQTAMTGRLAASTRLIHGPLGVAGPVNITGVRPGLQLQTVDILPTLLTRAGAVVPSDAHGISVLGEGIPLERPTFTITPAGLEVAMGDARLDFQRPETGWPAVLPPNEASPRLHKVAAVWYTRMRATDAQGRMGSQAFEKMLKDHGYW